MSAPPSMGGPVALKVTRARVFDPVPDIASLSIAFDKQTFHVKHGDEIYLIRSWKGISHDVAIYRSLNVLCSTGRISLSLNATTDDWAVISVALYPSFFSVESTDASTLRHIDVLMRYWLFEFPVDALRPELSPLLSRYTTALQLHNDDIQKLWKKAGFTSDSPDQTLRDIVFKLILPKDWQAETPNPKGLTSTLFRYQRRALNWMQWREQSSGATPDRNSVKSQISTLSPLWKPCVLPSGSTVYYNALTGEVSNTPVAAQPQVPGGCMCDEMGLGKTILVIALTLANKPPYEKPGAVEHTTSSKQPTTSKTSVKKDKRGGTLVVCPPALVEQWQNEINRHAKGALTVYEYKGLRYKEKKQDGDNDDKPPQEKPPKPKKIKGVKDLGLTAPMQKEYEWFVRMQMGETPPTEDLSTRADEEVQKMREADIVLTSFSILDQELHFNTKNPILENLRHKKRYVVPDCPLVQVEWWRLVADEAQMVGSNLKDTGRMVNRITARNRWCLTGTPLTSRRELSNVHDLLAILQHNEFADKRAWDWRLNGPLAPFLPDVASRLLNGEDAIEPQLEFQRHYTPQRVKEFSQQHHIIEGKRAWLLLLETLRPIMWRNTKEVVREEYHLPPRSLQVVKLQLQPGEKDFYQQLIEKARKHRRDLEEAEAGTMVGLDAASKRKRRKNIEELHSAFEGDLSELRLACIHPQLTPTWQKLHKTELQLQGGGALAMEEILEQMVHKMQVDLQDTERDLCSHLNTLAMVLMGNIPDDTVPGSPMSPSGAGPSSQPLTDDGLVVSPATKRRRKSVALTPELIKEAIELLEKSHRVDDKGIDGYSCSMEDLHKIPEPAQASSASWRAWKRVQINTNTNLTYAYRLNKEPDEKVALWEQKVEKRVKELREAAEKEVEQSQQRLEQAQLKIKTAATVMKEADAAALDNGFPSNWGLTTNTESWMDTLEEIYKSACADEAEEIEKKQGKKYGQAVMTGAVKKALEAEEHRLQPELTLLENYMSAVKTQEAAEEVERALSKDKGADPKFTDTRWLMGRANKLLPPFRRDTILNQFEDVFPIPRYVKRYTDGSVAGNQQQQQSMDDDGAGPSNPQEAAPALGINTDDAPSEWVKVDKLGEPLLDTAPAELLKAARQDPDVIPSAEWKGRIRGYAFGTRDGQTTGYWRDPIQLTKPTLEQNLHRAGQILLRSLKDHHTKTLNHCDAATRKIFAKAGRQATDSKLQSVSAQVQLLRLYKELHTAEGMLTLHTSQLEDVNAEVYEAQYQTLVSLRSPDALKRQIDKLVEDARSIKGKKGYMSNRLENATNEYGVQQTNIITSAPPPGEEEDVVFAEILPDDDDDDDNELVASTSKGQSAAAAVLGPFELPQRSSDECPVCLMVIENELNMFTSCGHVFCVPCAAQVLHHGGMCPVCRQKVTKRQVVRALAGSAKDKMQGEEVFDPEAVSNEHLKNVSIQGKWSIKIQALVRRLLALQEHASEEKSLVFSQFPAALALVRLALNANNIKNVSLTGGRDAVKKAVHDFTTDADIKVFLLSHRAGAQGLTLVQANNVFLLEPGLDPAIEQQAIARVHRMGQVKNVHIVRLLVSGSIEEQVLRIQDSRHALMNEEDMEGADYATTVAEATGKELIDESTAMELLNAVLE